MSHYKVMHALPALLLFLLFLWPQSAYAYIGPAIAFMSYLLGPVAAIFAAIGIILYLPVKSLLKKRAHAKQASLEAVANQDDK